VDGVALELRQIHRRRRLRHRARLARLRLGARQVLDLNAEVVEAIAVGIRIRRIPGALPADDGEVDVAVGEVHLAREVAVAARDLLQAERLLEQLRGGEGVFRGDRNVPDFSHGFIP
jgi:hypothetical protein